MICRKEKYIFIHIPKTAGSSIEKALVTPDCELLSNQREKGLVLNHLTINEAIKNNFISLEELKSFFVFAFVRNPWDRIVSDIFYLNFLPEFKHKTFPEKVRIYCEMDNYGNHIVPQVDFFKDYWQYVDFIGKFENLQQDFDHICTILKKSQINLLHNNKTRHPPYFKLLTPELIDLIRIKYQQDILKFNYKYIPSEL